jgi:methionyl-tRNA formyltransferase
MHKSVFDPGQVVDVSKNELFVQTGNGILSIIRLQLEGKTSLDIKSFLNGYSIKIGDYFGM